MPPTDYAKLKNAELEALLKERQLPQGGKKADMVARLAEHDQAQQDPPPSSSTAELAAAATATSEPAAAAIAAGGSGIRAPNPVDVPNQAAAIDPSMTSDLTAVKDTTTSTAGPLDDTTADAAAAAVTDGVDATPAPAAPAFTSNLHLAPTDIDAEIAKRKARATKFGISDGENEAIKALERAKRFGTGAAGEAADASADAATDAGASGVSRLDVALPERGARKRERVAPAGGDSWEDEGLKRRRGGGGGIRGRGGRGGGRDSRGGEDREKTKAKANGGRSWMSDADRAAADKRKAKFASAAS